MNYKRSARAALAAIIAAVFTVIAPGVSGASEPGSGAHIVSKNDNVTVWFVPGTIVHPMTASDCDGDVCMTVYGANNFVGTWDTQAYYGGTGTKCTIPHFYHFTIANGATEVNTGHQICASSPGTFYAEWNPNRNFANGLAINGWDNFTGSPNVVINSFP